MSVRIPLAIAGSVALAIAAAVPAAVAAPGDPSAVLPDQARAAEVAAHWTPEKRAAAIPRDLALDEQGRGYIRSAQGWQPYGAAQVRDPELTAEPATTSKPTPMAKPGSGTTDRTAPTVSNTSPAGFDVLTTDSITFRATVVDNTGGSGVKSVSVVITFPSGATRSYATTRTDTTYSTTLSGFANGSWSWRVVAKDFANNTATTADFPFTVSIGGGGGGGGTTVSDATWTGGGPVQSAAGRIYFEMPTNGSRWGGYVCSGTAISDGGAVNAFSLILTAAHCVYDDSKKVFARNVLFIPNQSETTGGGTDRDCTNDLIGCWVPSYGVVDSDWTGRTFPDNVQWDHAYYVVPNSGAHIPGRTIPTSTALESATPAMTVSFGTPSGSAAQAMGYSYSQDPLFRYCAEPLSTTGTVNWWLGSCGLSGGASGGPWLQPAGTGDGPIFSVNSWGYTNQPGMAGPKLNSTEASCLNGIAKDAQQTPANRGVIASCN